MFQSILSPESGFIVPKVTVYKNYDTDHQETLVSSGIRDKENSLFKFPPDANITIDDILQEEGGCIKWKVIDLDEFVFCGKLMHREAKVRRLD